MGKLKIRPLDNKIMVRRSVAEDRTSGGILLPDNAREKPKRGTVQAVGPGKLLDNGTRAAMQVAKGDEVVFDSYAGTEIKLDGEELLVINEDDVLAVVEK